MTSYPDDIPLSILFGTSDKMTTRQKKANYSDQNDDDFVEDEQVLHVNNEKKPKKIGGPPKRRCLRESRDNTAKEGNKHQHIDKKKTKKRGKNTLRKSSLRQKSGNNLKLSTINEKDERRNPKRKEEIEPEIVEGAEDKGVHVLEDKKPKKRGWPLGKKRKKKSKTENEERTTKAKGSQDRDEALDPSEQFNNNVKDTVESMLTTNKRGRRRKSSPSHSIEGAVEKVSSPLDPCMIEPDIGTTKRRRSGRRRSAGHNEKTNPAPVQVVPKRNGLTKAISKVVTITVPTASVLPRDTTLQNNRVSNDRSITTSPLKIEPILCKDYLKLENISRPKLPSIQKLYKSPLGLLGMLREDTFCQWNHEHGSNSAIALKVLKSLCCGKLPHVVQGETPFPRPSKEITKLSAKGGPPPRFYGVVRFDTWFFATEFPLFQMKGVNEEFSTPSTLAARGQTILLRACLDEFVAGQLYVFVIRLLYGHEAVEKIHDKCKCSSHQVEDILSSFGL